MSLHERLLDRLVPVTESGCWLWVGAVDANGYGKLGDGSKRVLYAHRVSWEAHNGPILDGKWVLHKCDTPSCANPAHLFLGDQSDNMQDMRRKGRGVDTAGEKSASAKLTASQANEIRDAVGTHREIAKRYGIDHSQVTRIKSGKSWKSTACKARWLTDEVAP